MKAAVDKVLKKWEMIEALSNHKEALDKMKALAFKQYGGLGGVKNILKVEVQGSIFWEVLNSFDADGLFKMLENMDKKPVVKKEPKSPKKKTTKKAV